MPKSILFFFVLFTLACQSTDHKAAQNKSEGTPAPVQSKSNPQPSLVYKMHEPMNKSKSAPLLVLLHGRGSNENIFYNMAPNLDRRLRVISVQGPLKMGEGRFAWYDLQRDARGLSKYDGEEVLAMSDRLVEFINELIEAKSLKPAQIFIGGFSQGAIMSLGTGLRHPEVIDGVLCFSGALYPEFMADFSLQDAHKDLSILITHGKNDRVLPFADIEYAVDLLKSKALQVSFKEYDSAHNFPPDNFRDFREWLVEELDTKEAGF